MHSKVHYNIFTIAKLSINRQMDKDDVIYIYAQKVLLSHEKK